MTQLFGVRKLFPTAALASMLFAGIVPPADACTGIRLIATDGTVVHARTLEFAIDLESSVIVVPRGFARRGTTPDGKSGLQWKSKYASVGANGVGLPIVFDGLNEKGLSAALFYFPGSAEYMPYTAADASQTVAPWELGSWILENCASVDDVKAKIGKIVVPAVVFEAWGFVPGVHFKVDDASGKSIVIEYSGGKLHLYDNPLGVLTNSPTFDWHMTNLRNYINFSMTNHPVVQLGSVKLEPFGQGSGMLGLPGDFTPPSRFVRAVAFSHSVITPATGKDAVLEAFHVLNQFDIPMGAAREHEKDSHGNVIADYTLWTAASNLKTKQYYFRTYDNSQIRMVDLKQMNLDAKGIAAISMKGPEVIEQLAP